MSSQPQNTIQLRDLKLQAMAEAYELQSQQPKLQNIAFDSWMISEWER